MKIIVDDLLHCALGFMLFFLALLALILLSVFCYYTIKDPYGTLCKRDVSYKIIKMDYKND